MAHQLPAFREPTAVEKLFNRVFGLLVGLGLGFSHNYLLQVRGRKSGKLYSTPIDLLEQNGKRYLVAPRGRTQWVRNAEAAGEIILKRGSKRQKYRLRPIFDLHREGPDSRLEPTGRPSRFARDVLESEHSGNVRLTGDLWRLPARSRS